MRPYTSEEYRKNVDGIEVYFSNSDYKKLFPNRINTHDISDCILLDMVEKMWKTYQFNTWGEFTHELWAEQIERSVENVADCEEMIMEYGLYASVDDFWEGRDVSSPEGFLQSIARGILREYEPKADVLWELYQEKIVKYIFRNHP